MRLGRIALAGLCCLFVTSACAPRSTVGAPRSTVSAPAQRATSVAPAKQPLRFAWPDGATAEVTERILKKGRRSTTHYRIVTERDGDDWLIFYRDFEFREVEGLDLRDPRVVAALDKVAAQTVGRLPPYRVSSDGGWLGIDMDAFLAAMKGVLPDETVANLHKAMAVPGMAAMLDEKLSDVWGTWVELWIDMELEPGERLDGAFEVTVLDRPISVPVTVEHLGTVDGRVRIRASSVLEGPAAAAAVGTMVSQFSESVDGDTPLPVSDWNSLSDQMEIRRVWTAETVTDPMTLLPAEARFELRVTVTADGEKRERVEAHEWVFDWSSGSDETR